MSRVKDDSIKSWMRQMPHIYQGHNCFLVGTITFDRDKVRVVSVLSPTLVLLHCTENWQSHGTFKIARIVYPKTPRSPSDLVSIKIVCDFWADLKLQKHV